MKYSGAANILSKFAEKFGIPFSETQAGKGAIISSHSLNVGGIGETGCLAANTLAKEADLIIGIGTRYTDFTTSSKWIFQNPNVNYLNINISRFDALKLDGVDIIADAKVALESLFNALSESDYQADWEGKIEQARNDYIKEVKRV